MFGYSYRIFLFFVNLFLLCCITAFSALVARESKNFFLSFQELFLTSCLISYTMMLGLFSWPLVTPIHVLKTFPLCVKDYFLRTAIPFYYSSLYLRLQQMAPAMSVSFTRTKNLFFTLQLMFLVVSMLFTLRRLYLQCGLAEETLWIVSSNLTVST